MPLVFVHGVNTREDTSYRENQKVRDSLFRRFALDEIVSDPGQVKIENPYWGQYGARFAWNHACLPDDRYEQFGSEEIIFGEIVAEIVPNIATQPNQLLLTVARESLLKAVDCLWLAAAYTDVQQSVVAPLTAMSWKAVNYAEANPRPTWLEGAANDDQFLDRLLDAIEAWTPSTTMITTANQTEVESFGISDIWNHMKAAGTQLANAAAGQVVQAVRPWGHQRVALFLGDVFEYLNSRGHVGSEGKIVKEVGDAFRRAAAAIEAGKDDKLIIVAHSMGGNIAYDILSYFLPDLECDLLLTVGSQVGLFEELKLFRSSDKQVPSLTQKQVTNPKNIKHWLNVVDPVDVLGYSTSRIFSGSRDYIFSTGTHPLSAHSMYFYRPSFHQRLSERIRQR
jgi:hypothetical protein